MLLAGVRLLEAQNQQNASRADATDRSIGEETFGELNEHLNFSPLTETEMIQESLDVLANYQQDAIPHNQVEAWVKSLGTDHEQPCPQ